MKVCLAPEETYTLQIGDCVIEGFRVLSRWNGLTEMRNASNEILIVSAPDIRPVSSRFDTLFGDIFRTAGETKDAGVVVVMGSPDLIARLRAATVPTSTKAESPTHEPSAL
jgi:hypothetical protein